MSDLHCLHTLYIIYFQVKARKRLDFGQRDMKDLVFMDGMVKYFINKREEKHMEMRIM